MGVRKWMDWLVPAGLAAVFFSFRIFAEIPWLRWAFLALGAGGVLAAMLIRYQGWNRQEGDRREIAAWLFFPTLGCFTALLGLVAGTEAGVEWLGLHFDSVPDEIKYRRICLVASTLVLAASILPLLAAQWSVRRGKGRDPSRVDLLRIRETTGNALSLALAGCGLSLMGYVAAASDVTVDVSYFKTSRPGDAVQELVRNAPEEVEVALFFPAVNSVLDEVRTYFRELQAASGNLVLEEYDRYADREAATEFTVRSDGSVVFRRGDRVERILLSTELREARGRLREFDSHVQQALLKLNRSRAMAYLTIGHGEASDPLTRMEDQQALGNEPPRRGAIAPGAPSPLEVLRTMLDLLNYGVQDLGLRQGLGEAVPDDAAMVAILAPRRPFLDEELAALERYLDAGGSLLIALEPRGDFNYDWLERTLGIVYDPVMTLVEQGHIRQFGNDADRRLVIANRFSAHESVTTPSRQGGGGVLVVGSGEVGLAEDSVPGLRSTLVLRSPDQSFLDRNENFQRDADEEMESRGLVAAVEGDSLRALVYGDAELFSDQVLASLNLNRAMVADGIRWLGREEMFAGQVTSEEDIPIMHTRSENVAWFYAIILGAPALVLGLGLLYVYRRGAVRPARQARPWEKT